MSRFSVAMKLVSREYARDEFGAFSEKESARTVFANRMTMGASPWAAAKAAGLSADASVQMRSCDYNGELEAEIGGTEYEVERVSDSGEFCVLTLKRRLSND